MPDPYGSNRNDNRAMLPWVVAVVGTIGMVVYFFVG